MNDSILIGISSGILHDDRERTLFNGRELHFVEWGMSDWVARSGMTAVALPYPASSDTAYWDSLVKRLDGVLLHGGADVAPESYGQSPLRPEWSGDAKRDRFELEICRAAIRNNVPVLGVCRGHQLLNVALGGTLFQDISTQVDEAITHRDADTYEDNAHLVEFATGSTIASLYGVERAVINSVHHQSIDQLGDGLVVEGWSPHDQIVEAVWLDSGEAWARGVQWHPEFQRPDQTQLLDPMPLLHDFAEAMRARK